VEWQDTDPDDSDKPEWRAGPVPWSNPVMIELIAPETEPTEVENHNRHIFRSDDRRKRDRVECTYF